MKRTSKSQLFTILFLLFIFPWLSYAQRAYDHIVIFGDSLSDPGNAFILTGNALTPPYETVDAMLIPDAPYAIGGNRFSNGPTWVEQLAESLELEYSAGPAFAKETLGEHRRTNYAVGGARARDNGININLTDQVNIYLSQSANSPGEETLFVIEFVGNDTRDAIAALALDPNGGISGEIISAALTSVSDNVITLYAHGAREFLISNGADLSLTPAIRILDAISPGSSMAAAIISAQYNAGIDQVISQLEAQLPDISITKLDIYGQLHDAVANSHRYRLSNVTDACIRPNTLPYHCKKAKRYLFWDGIHPTEKGHSIFAELGRKLIIHKDSTKKHRNGDRRCREERGFRTSCHH